MCGICADLIEVGIALTRDREGAVRSAPVPPSGAVWWRMQLRMRREAELSARRTVTLVQGAILGTCSFVALGILVVLPAPATWLQPFVWGSEVTGPAAAHAGPWSPWFMLAIAAWIS